MGMERGEDTVTECETDTETENNKIIIQRRQGWWLVPIRGCWQWQRHGTQRNGQIYEEAKRIEKEVCGEETSARVYVFVGC